MFADLIRRCYQRLRAYSTHFSSHVNYVGIVKPSTGNSLYSAKYQVHSEDNARPKCHLRKLCVDFIVSSCSSGLFPLNLLSCHRRAMPLNVAERRPLSKRLEIFKKISMSRLLLECLWQPTVDKHPVVKKKITCAGYHCKAENLYL